MDIGYLITNIANGTRQRFDNFFAREGLTYPQYRALMWIFLQPEDKEINQQSLCNALCVKPSSISSMVRNLEKEGYLERYQSEHDSRNKRLVLTDKARKLRDKLEAARANGEKQILTGLSQEQISVLHTALEQILKNVEQ